MEKTNQPAETNALDKKFQMAVIEARKRGCESQLHDFQNAMKESFVVINMKEKELLSFLTDDTRKYENYFLLVEAGIRPPYSPVDDEQRRTAEVKLFGRYASEIRYGALTLDGLGLHAYGCVAVKLKSNLIESCTSFFVDNSLAFMKKYQIEVMKPFPKGFIANWGSRAKLAVAKAFHPQKSSPETEPFAKLALNSTGDKYADSFIEAHIYGGFTNANFEFVKWQGNGSKVSRARAKKIKVFLNNKKIGWENL